MEQIDLTVVGKQHFALPGNAMMEQCLKEECGDAFSDLKKELEGETEPVEIILVGEEADRDGPFTGDDKDRLIGELVGKIMNTAHELCPETEFSAVGTLTREEDGFIITYEETAITGMDGSVTVLRVADNGVVSLNRGGKVATNLVFEKGKRCQCMFDNYGPKGLPVVIYTRDMTLALGKGRGKIRIDYTIEVGGAKTEHDEFFISWKSHKEGATHI